MPLQKMVGVRLTATLDPVQEEEEEEPHCWSRSPLPPPSVHGRGSEGRDHTGDDQQDSREHVQIQDGEECGEICLHIPDLNGQKLGIDTYVCELYPAFNITKIQSDGLISNWNRENPHLMVTVGDSLVEINGVRGDTEKISEQLGMASELYIQIKRNAI